MATQKAVMKTSRIISITSITYRNFSTKNQAETFYISGYQALQKKRSNIKLSNVEWKPDTLTLQENKWIMNASKAHEVINIAYETLKDRPSRDKMSAIFNCAIRKCVELHAYPQCWTLFVSAKQTHNINTQIYTTMIWMCLNSSHRVHFDKAFDLYKEMQLNVIAISNHTYAALINGCAKKYCYSPGIAIWNDMQNDRNVIPDIKAWNAIIMLYAFNKDMNNANQMYENMQNNGHIMPDNYTYTLLLNGYATLISHVLKYDMNDINIYQILTRAENIFYDAVIAWNKKFKSDCINSNSVFNDKENNQRMFVIQAWMNVYASIGDIYCCLTIFKWLLKSNEIQFECDIKMSTKKKKRISQMDEWLNDTKNMLNNNGCYKLTIQIFGIVLKACLNQPKLCGDELMAVMMPLMDIMLDKCGIKPSTDIYGMLFQLYQRMKDRVSLNELQQLYDDMKSKCVCKPTERELNEYARTYLSFMKHNGMDKQQIQEFKYVLLNEFEQLNVTPSIYTKELIDKEFQCGDTQLNGS